MTQKLLLENCLTFGQDSRFTSKKITRYLLGTRITTEIFKLYELRSLLLKIYPLIHNLFYNPRVNPKLRTKKIGNINGLDSKINLSNKRHQFAFRFKSFRIYQMKNLPPQILFATVTPAFAEIIQSAARICHMPVQKNR